MTIHDKPPEISSTTPQVAETKVSFLQKIARAFSLGGRKVSTKPPDGTPKPQTPEVKKTNVSYSGTREPAVDKSILHKIKTLFTNIFSKSSGAETTPSVSVQPKTSEDVHIDRIVSLLATYHYGGTDSTAREIISDVVTNELAGYPKDKALNIVGQAIYKLEKDHRETMREEHGMKEFKPEKWAVEMKAVLKEETDNMQTVSLMQPNDKEASFKETLTKYANPNQKYIPEDSKVLNEYFKSTNVDEGAKALADLYKQNKDAAIAIIKNISIASEFKGVDQFVAKFVTHLGVDDAGKFVTKMLMDEIETITDKGTFLRGNTLSTKFVSAFQNLALNDVTQYQLNPFFDKVPHDKIRDAAPPRSDNPFQVAKSNEKKLTAMTNQALDQFVEISKDLPPAVKKMFQSVYTATETKFGPDVAKQQVLSLLFLRYGNPMFTNYLAKLPNDSNQRSNLMMVAKVLQNFASNVHLKEKEPYLAFMDKSFIDKNSDKRDEIFKNLIST